MRKALRLRPPGARRWVLLGLLVCAAGLTPGGRAWAEVSSAATTDAGFKSGGPGAPAPVAAPGPVRRPEESEFEPVTGPPQAPYGEDEGFGTQFVKTLLALGIVILITYLVLNVGLRRLMGLQGVRAAGGGLVQVIERHPLEAKKTLYVVRVGHEYLLVGAGEQGLSLLRELDADSIDKALAERASHGPSGGALLEKLLNRRNKES